MNSEAEMDLFDHLDELRTRILRMLVYIAVGMGLAWTFSGPIYNFLLYPLKSSLKDNNAMVMGDIMQGFMLTMQLSLIGGLILAAPFILAELWGFIKPALTLDEQKPVRYLTPFASLLFFSGVAVAYISLPIIYYWMTTFMPEGTELLQQVSQAIIFAAKMMLGCGLLFELPVLLLFLARVGIVNDKMLVTYWRHAVVGIFALAAVATPSPDPISCTMVALPLAVLYGLSILLVRGFAPQKNNGKVGEIGEVSETGEAIVTSATKPMNPGMMTAICLAPAIIIGACAYWGYRTRVDVKPNISQSVVKNRADLDTLAKQVEELRNTTKASPAPAPTPDPQLQKQQDQMREEIAALKKEVEELKTKIAPLIETPPAPVPTPDPGQTVQTGR